MSNYNISSRCINHNISIDLRSEEFQHSRTLKVFCFERCIYFLAIKVQNFNNRIKFKITDLLYIRNILGDWTLKNIVTEFCRGRAIVGSALKNYRWPPKNMSKESCTVGMNITRDEFTRSLFCSNQFHFHGFPKVVLFIVTASLIGLVLKESWVPRILSQ